MNPHVGRGTAVPPVGGGTGVPPVAEGVSPSNIFAGETPAHDRRDACPTSFPRDACPTTAFILGAGLGTRLRPLTARRPKPLIPLGDRPLIAHTFDRLLGLGVQRLVVNTHWQAARYRDFFPTPNYGPAELIFREETPEILETAGGIWNVRDLLGDAPFLVYNGDIWSDLPLAPAFAAHRQSGAEITLVLRSSGGPLQVACDATGRVTDIGGRVDSAAAPRYLFTGIYLVEPRFIARIPAAQKISVVPLFCEMIRLGAALRGIVIDEGHWWDLGTREQYLDSHRALATILRSPRADLRARFPTAEFTGATFIAPGAHIGAHARLHDCVVWDGAVVATEAQLDRCILTDGARVEGIHADADF